MKIIYLVMGVVAFLLFLLLIWYLGQPEIDIIPSRCNMPAQFDCFEHMVSYVNSTQLKLQVVLVSQLDKVVTIDSSSGAINASSQYGSAASGTVSECAFDSTSVQPGYKTMLECNLSAYTNSTFKAFPSAGQKIKVVFDFRYKEDGQASYQPVHAEVLTTEQ